MRKLSTSPLGGLGRDVLGWNFLFMQRHSARVPARVRRFVRRRLSRAVTLDTAPVEDWVMPLVHSTGALPVHWPETDCAPGVDHGTLPSAQDQGGAPVRCLIATESLDAGGMDEVVGFLARGLQQFGLRVAILHTPADGASTLGRLGQELRNEGIEVANVGRENCEAWIRDWEPDVLSVHGVPNWVPEAASRYSVPTVETLHGMHNEFNATVSGVSSRRGLLAGLVSVAGERQLHRRARFRLAAG